MIILSAQDLEDYGVRQTASTITFMGKAFVRGQTFAQRLRKMAIAMAEESMERGAACLLVDFDTHITVWKEQKNAGGSSALQPQAKDLNIASSPSMDSAEWIDARTLPKNHPSNLKYRGQSPSTSPSPEGQDLSRLLSEHDIKYRGKSVKPASSPQFSQADATNNGSSIEQQQPKAKRKVKYRGRWVDAD